MTNEIYNLFKKNMGFVVREDQKVKDIISNPENKIILKIIDNKLVGVSVINKNTILLLCVDKDYQNRGIGSELLAESENYVDKIGFDIIRVGAGYDYITPGVPTSQMVIKENLKPDNITPGITDNAKKFFEKRGYYHFWDANCFDMKMNLADYKDIGNDTDNIKYVFATLNDINKITNCTDDAHEEFTKYYKDSKLYNGGSQYVLVAKDNDTVVGTLIISNQTEGKNIGSVGCTTVRHSYRGRHIGVNLVSKGTKHLKEKGLKTGFLGYTYSGLDKMYGYSGYKICCYYFMAEKKLKNKQ